jgi:hypothetical protein
MPTSKKQTLHLASSIAPIISLWFGHTIKDQASSLKGFDLAPNGAICLALMTIKSTASSDEIAALLGPEDLRFLDKTEARIVVEYGMDSLMKGGYVRLDAEGKKEFSRGRANGHYGHPGVNWTLTAKGAKRAAPLYCTNIDKPSEYQKQAIVDMLEANKASIQRARQIGSERQVMAKSPVKTVTKAAKKKSK